MLNHTVRLLAVAGLLAATSRVAHADVCVNIDRTRDTLATEERVAAILLVAKQFELEGERVVPEGCPAPYVLAHARLGSIIVVSLSGPNGRREAIAHGMDDLPALYSQICPFDCDRTAHDRLQRRGPE